MTGVLTLDTYVSALLNASWVKNQFTIYHRIKRTDAQLNRYSINQYKLTCD